MTSVRASVAGFGEAGRPGSAIPATTTGCNVTLLRGDALTKLRELPSESVHCCVTSPPFWGLRDYGTASWEGGDNGCDHSAAKIPIGNSPSNKSTLATNNGKGPQPGDKFSNGSQFGYAQECKCGAKRIDAQLGLEKTPEEYVAKMVEVFREVRRVLRKDGTLWLNLGSSMAGSWGNYHPDSPPGKHGQRLKETARWNQPAYSSQEFLPPTANLKSRWKPKDMIPIPWMVAMALQADGWWLRQDIIWSKPNPMPESVTDRCTKSHEYLFLLTKSARYFYDAEAIKDRSITNDIRRPYGSKGSWDLDGRPDEQKHGGEPRSFKGSKFNTGKTAVHQLNQSSDSPRINGNLPGRDDGGAACNKPGQEYRNKRSVWTVATAPYAEAHFATYPPDLIKPCILAGTSAKGCCANCGAPWERIVESESLTPKDYNGKNVEQDPQFSGRRMLANLRASREAGYGDSFPPKQTLGWRGICRCPEVSGQKPEVSPCTILDPFAGSGTTGQVALELGRSAILFELNPAYHELIDQRCRITPGLALA